MAVDKGYGSGKPLSAAQSASRRAAAGKAASRKKTGAAAAKNYGQKKNMMYTNPGMLASQKKRMTLDNRRTSANALENLTGFNSRDGVDAGDLAGLAISIPTAGLGGALLRGGARVAKMAIPKAARVTAAATRLSKAAKTKQAVESSFAKYYSDQAGQEATNYYSAKYSSTGTRGAMQDATNAERSYLARSQAAAKAAERIAQSGRLDPVENAANILARLDRLKTAKRRANRNR